MNAMTIQRMDNVGIVVEDLDAAIAFFTELGMELEGKAQVEGAWAEGAWVGGATERMSRPSPVTLPPPIPPLSCPFPAPVPAGARVPAARPRT